METAGGFLGRCDLRREAWSRSEVVDGVVGIGELEGRGPGVSREGVERDQPQIVRRAGCRPVGEYRAVFRSPQVAAEIENRVDAGTEPWQIRPNRGARDVGQRARHEKRTDDREGPDGRGRPQAGSRRIRDEQSEIDDGSEHEAERVCEIPTDEDGDRQDAERRHCGERRTTETDGDDIGDHGEHPEGCAEHEEDRRGRFGGDRLPVDR